MKRHGGGHDAANTGRALQDKPAGLAARDDVDRERRGIRRLVSGAAGPFGRIPAAGGDPGIPGRNSRDVGDPAGRAEPADIGAQGAFGSPERRVARAGAGGPVGGLSHDRAGSRRRAQRPHADERQAGSAQAGSVVRGDRLRGQRPRPISSPVRVAAGLRAHAWAQRDGHGLHHEVHRGRPSSRADAEGGPVSPPAGRRSGKMTRALFSFGLAAVLAGFPKSSFSQGEKLQHDPFARPALAGLQHASRPGPARNGEPTAASTRRLKLQAVMVAGPKSIANVDGTMVRIGDQIYGYRLVEVHERGAVFEKNKTRVAVSIRRDAGQDNDAAALRSPAQPSIAQQDKDGVPSVGGGTREGAGGRP